MDTSLQAQYTERLEKASARLEMHISSLVDTAKTIQMGAKTQGMVLTDYEAYLLAIQLLEVANK